MSESKDAQIAALRAENTQLRDELGDARRKMERLAAMLQSLWGSDGPAEVYQLQRDYALATLKEMRWHFENKADDISNLFRSTERMPIVGHEWRRYQPFAIGLSDAITMRIDSEEAQNFATKERQIQHITEEGASIAPDVDYEIAQLIWHAQRWALYVIGIRWRMSVWNIVDKPEFLALDVLSISKQGVLPDDELIARLCQTWENGPTPNSLLEALKTAIVWHQRKAHQKQEAVAQKLGIDARTLRHRLKLYEDLRELAASATIEDENLS